MMVHRLLTKYLDQGGRTVSEQKYEALCEHSSSMEQIASNAERASIKYKQVEFMTERLGQTFDGVISGVTEWGLYVELNENKCEGMIPIRDLDDDYYEFDEKNYCLRGRRKNKIYSLGDGNKAPASLHHLLRRTRAGLYAPASGMQLQHEVAQCYLSWESTLRGRHGREATRTRHADEAIYGK